MFFRQKLSMQVERFAAADCSGGEQCKLDSVLISPQLSALNRRAVLSAQMRLYVTACLHLSTLCFGQDTGTSGRLGLSSYFARI